MFGWILKKIRATAPVNTPVDTPTGKATSKAASKPVKVPPAAAKAAVPTAAQTAAKTPERRADKRAAAVPVSKAPQTVPSAQPTPKPASLPPQTSVDWDQQLQAATDDDEALLTLAQSGAPLTTRLAAVTAITGEDALKRAERNLRNQDRRLHRLAKQRHTLLQAQRTARAEADRLIAEGQALAGASQFAVNRAVALDRAWAAVDQSLITPEQAAAFAGLTAQLSAHAQDSADRERQHGRWLLQADAALRALQTASTAAANGEMPRETFGDAVAAARAVHADMPDGAVEPVAAALGRALDIADALATRLVLLEQLLNSADVVDEPPAPVVAVASPQAVADAPVIGPADASDAADAAPAQPAESVQPNQPAHAEAPETPDAPAQLEAPDALDASDAAKPTDPLQTWQQLPPLADPALAAALQTRLRQHQQSRQAAASARQAHTSAAQRASAREQRRAPVEPARAATPEQVQAAWAAAAEATDAVEAALAAGQLGDAQRQLQQVDTLLQGHAPDPALQARLAAAQAQYAQLKGWQHWSGGLARDELTLQAEALAAATVAARASAAPATAEADAAAAAVAAAPSDTAADTAADAPPVVVETDTAGTQPGDTPAAPANTSEAPATPPALPTAPTPPTPPATLPIKLSIQQQAELIDDLRARWKELDRLGGASSRALWQRFDMALKTAFEPVAAQRAAQRAAREQNLAARQQLLLALEALPLHGAAADGGSQANTSDDGATGDDQPSNPNATPAWRPLIGALDQFRAEWRKLGPVEHTVPHKARDAIAARWQAAVQRVEQPLHDARRVAQQQREALIDRARALAAEAEGSAPRRDLIDSVRALQFDWQQHAKSLPLPRGVESALWDAFKGATDAVFRARDAAFQARDAEFQGHAAARLAVIDGLETLAGPVAAEGDAPPAHTAGALRKALADADAQWRAIGPAPRADAADLDARFRAARDAVQQRLHSSEQGRWQSICNALVAKLALCEQAEAGAAVGDDAPAQAAERWAALPALPAKWDQALSSRLGLAGTAGQPPHGRAQPPAATPGAEATCLPTDTLLLQLEAACGLPSPAAHEAARRDLKLQAMKAAMEGRRGPAAASDPEALFCAALARPALDDAQRARLAAVIDALRRRGRLTDGSAAS